MSRITSASAVSPENRVCLNLFGRWLAVKRADEGLTQEELAERMGDAKGWVGSWERGYAPAARKIPHIADALRVEKIEVMGRHWGNEIANSALYESILQDNFRQIFVQLVGGVGHGWGSRVFGAHIREWRNNASREEAAQRLNVSDSFVESVEKGQSFPGADELSRWSVSTGIPLAELAARRTVDILVNAMSDSELDFQEVLGEAARLSPDEIARLQHSNLFGARIREWRGDTGVTEAGRRMNMSHTFLSRVEKGTRIPAMDALARWSESTGIPLAELAARRTVDTLINAMSDSELDFQEVLGEAARLSQEGVVRIQRSNLFGARIREWRGNISLREACKSLNVCHGFLSHVERGEAFPGSGELIHWSQATGIPHVELAARLVIDQAVRDYGFMNLNLEVAFQNAIRGIPQDLREGFGPIQPLTGSTPRFLIDKIREVLQQHGQSPDDSVAMTNLAETIRIPAMAFRDFVRGELPIRDFLTACGDDDVFEKLGHRLGYAYTHVVGWLGLDLAFAYEALEGRRPEYVSHALENGNPSGYDIRSQDRRIEVKASSTVSPFYTWSSTEWEAAEAAGNQAYLLLVLNASTPEPTLVEIQNPTAQLEGKPYGDRQLITFKNVRNLVESRGHAKALLLPGVIKVPYEEARR